MRTTITLTDNELELVRREMLKSAARDLEACAKHLDQLGTTSPWPIHPLSDDVRCSVSIAREALDVLDSVGYPSTDQAEEGER